MQSLLSTLNRVSRRANLAARKDELARARTRAVDSPDIQRDLIRRHSNPPRASRDHFRPPSHPPVHVFERDHLSCELATSTTCCKTRRSYRSGEALFEICTLHDRGHDGLDAVPCSGVQTAVGFVQEKPTRCSLALEGRAHDALA